MTRPSDPWVFVNHICDAIQSCQKYYSSVKNLEEFLQDEKTQDAVVRKLAIIGEATSNLSGELSQSIQKLIGRT